MAEEGKSRLGRGLAALIGEVGDEMGNLERKGFVAALGAGGVPAPEPAQSAQGVRRCGSAGADPVDQGSRHHPADRGAADARTRPDEYEIVAGERRWRAAQKAGPARGAGGGRRHRRQDLARIRDPRERPARRPQSHRGGGRLFAPDGRVLLHAGEPLQDHRQEPQPHRQHAAPHRPAGRRAQDADGSASSPPAMAARCCR